jgi:hypothetical protein
MLRLALVLLAACEKSGPVEETPGSSSTAGSSSPATPRALPDAAVATLPNDAQKLAPDAAPVDPSFADLMTVDGEIGVAESMGTRGRPGSDLATQIQDVRDRDKVRIGGRTGRGSSPVGRIAVSGKEAFDETTLTPERVLLKMRSTYMSGIKGCYKTYLAKDPSARGKVRLTFTVNEAGRTLMPKAAGFATELDDCLSQRMTAWLFARPKDRDGEATEASFALVLELVPD